MSKRNKECIYGLVAVILLSTLLSYFVHPHPPQIEIVSARQELPNFTERYPGDTSLADRVANSYGIAMVLMQTADMDKNVIALDALRSWAQNKFTKQPNFLHPVKSYTARRTA